MFNYNLIFKFPQLIEKQGQSQQLVDRVEFTQTVILVKGILM